VFVTGASRGRTSGFDYATVAYQAATGKRLWASRYNGPANRFDFASGLAVSSDGRRVYVTGGSPARNSAYDFATVAYSAATGAASWAQRYNGRASRGGFAGSIAVSQDGHRVFVTGGSQGATSHFDYATVAYAAVGGAPLWTRRFNGQANLDDAGRVVLVSPLGGTVVVCGTSTAQNPDYTAIAYNTVTGVRKGGHSYSGASQADNLFGAGVGPGGGRILTPGFA